MPCPVILLRPTCRAVFDVALLLTGSLSLRPGSPVRTVPPCIRYPQPLTHVLAPSLSGRHPGLSLLRAACPVPVVLNVTNLVECTEHLHMLSAALDQPMGLHSEIIPTSAGTLPASKLRPAPVLCTTCSSTSNALLCHP